MICISDLQEGYYTVTEIEGLEGYHWDESPRTVEVKAGKLVVVEVENEPASSLLIIKTDMQTGEPLQDVSFDIAKQNGEKIGTFTTDRNGRITVDLQAGTYTVVETAARESYELDTKVHTLSPYLPRQTAAGRYRTHSP